MRILPEPASVRHYYGHKRPEMLRFIPGNARRVLELGCGAGVFSAAVKKSRGEDIGIFDRTHLRFFTRSSIVRMFEDAGYSMQRIKGINPFWGLLGRCSSC